MSDIGVTLTKFIMEEQRRFPGATGNLTSLLSDLATAAKIIACKVRRAGLINIIGAAGYQNVQGEEVQKLDVSSNTVMLRTLEHGGYLAAMASEEMDGIYLVPEQYPRGRYLALFDPLDGSSNIDVNVSIGTIFSILKTESHAPSLKDFLQPGTEQVCAGYFCYSASTMLVYTVGHGVHGFTLDPGVGEFILSHENMRIPETGAIYSVNEGNSAHWYKGTTRYVSKLKEGAGSRKVTSRYIGSLVADFHRNLIRGGIYLYPSDKKVTNGKIRLLYEANPLAFIAEQAGGMASTGEERIMEVVPDELHQRVPLLIGSRNNVEEAVHFWREGED